MLLLYAGTRPSGKIATASSYSTLVPLAVMRARRHRLAIA